MVQNRARGVRRTGVSLSLYASGRARFRDTGGNE